ncbi:methylated-DNA--[protein]-cysteine S-methyltransferase [Arthrobacter sp. zg-ZUI100]|uniref:methylated-DNA--[protein]-cysteine S-methyltransferase n=1 Tax=Arthrobacter jiangjiafuii TaxID=2817475 RepID=UPI001AED2FC0|nr:methylated-DNA--[protein]-cysteine S-methyltransferase [Arthrobacter jiangjiafuii]MBP3035601.1 methylated-DNA--[protein]-cysteine S-methyltransferase [Arthrobacter jiangjiafuii]
MTALHAVMASPIGELTLLADGGALAAVYMENHKRGPARELLGTRVELDDDAVCGAGDAAAAGREVAPGREASAAAVLARTRDQLAEYFAGERREFDLPMAPAGNPFRQQVWALLQEIPYGETRSYGDLARQLGDRNLAQAVGSANARNPVSIIIPCHRVVGAAGALTGYAGGLARKHFLLGLEDPRRIQDALF